MQNSINYLQDGLTTLINKQRHSVMPSEDDMSKKKTTKKKASKRPAKKTIAKQKAKTVKAKPVPKKDNKDIKVVKVDAHHASGLTKMSDAELQKARDGAPVVSIMQELQMAAQINKRPARRFSSGVRVLDSIMSSRGVSGLKCGIYLLAGDPGAGKSSFALQIMRNMLEDGHPGVYLAYEGKDQIYDVIRRIRLPQVIPVVDRDDKRWVPDAENLCLRLKELHAENRTNVPAVVTIDTIKNLNASQGGIRGRRQAMKELSECVQKTNTILFLIAHVSKETRGKKAKRIQGPAELEELCDVRIDLVDITPEEAGDSEVRDVMLDINKNRFGRPGKFVGFTVSEDGVDWPSKVVEMGNRGPATKRSDDM